MAVEYMHSRHHVLGENGENKVSFFQNTVRDVKMADNSTETIRGHILYRTPDCVTSSDVPDKVIDCNNFSLKKGVTIAVKFAEDNIAEGPTLNVNNTGAFPVKKNGEVINADFIVAGHVYMFNFNGNDWDLIGSDGAMKVVKYDNDETKRYITAVTGEGNNKDLGIHDLVYTIGKDVYGYASNMEVEFEEPEVSGDTDHREAYVIDSGHPFQYLIRNIKAVIKGLGSLAFKSKVSIDDLEDNFKAVATDAVTKNELYIGTDYTTPNEKALDATVGKTLNDKIVELEETVENMVRYEWDANTATLNIITE